MLSREDKIKATVDFFHKCKWEGFAEMTEDLYDLPVSDAEIDRLYQKVQEVESKYALA